MSIASNLPETRTSLSFQMRNEPLEFLTVYSYRLVPMSQRDSSQTGDHNHLARTNPDMFHTDAVHDNVRVRALWVSRLGFVPRMDRESVSLAHHHKFAADQGHADGQFLYGLCLYRGYGVSVDKRLSAHYLKLAADQGHAHGQFNYGVCLYRGDGVSVDERLSAHYLKLAADQGHADGQFNYGLCLSRGDGLCVDNV
jgi:hypothetical protein